jgi:hypothetical protein
MSSSGRTRWIVLTAVLGALLGAHAALRLDGIEHNYPYQLYVDEGYVAHRAQEMYRERTLDPGRYDYNPLLMTAIDAAMRVVVLFRGEHAATFRQSIKYVPHSPFGPKAAAETVTSEEIVDPPIFLLVGRTLVAIAGTCALWFMFLLLREFMTVPAAVAATAWFGAVPTLVEYSHYVVNDIPMMLAYTAMYWCTVRWWRTGRDRWLYAAGALVGTVCSFKTTGVLALGYPAVVLLVSSRSLRDKLVRLSLLSLLALATFHILSPAMFGKYPKIVENLFDQERFYREAYPVTTVSLLDHLLGKRCFGLLPLVLALAGTVLAAFDMSNRKLLLASFAYLAGMLAFFSRYTFQPVRSILPLFPLIVLLASYGIVSLVARVMRARPRWQSLVATALLAVLAIQFSSHALRERRIFLADRDSRVRVLDRLQTVVMPGQSIAVPETVGFHPLAIAESKLPIQVVPTGDRDRFLAADWVVIPAVASVGTSALPRYFADLRQALKAQGRKAILRVGNHPITAEGRNWRGRHVKLELYPPPEHLH